MRFTLIKDLKKDKSMNPILKGLLVFIVLYLIVDVFLKEQTMGLSSKDILHTLFGNVDEYVDPMSEALFLEFIHMEIFFEMMMLLTLNAVFTRLMYLKPLSLFVSNITLITAILSLITIALTYFYAQVFVFVYVISFFIWHIGAFYMALSSLWRLQFD